MVHVLGSSPREGTACVLATHDEIAFVGREPGPRTAGGPAGPSELKLNETHAETDEP